MPAQRLLPECPIPQGAQVESKTSRVFVILNDGKAIKRRIVGHSTDGVSMHPSSTFKDTFPSLWRQMEAAGQDCEGERAFGSYAFLLSLATIDGLYPILTETLGAAAANAFMDLNLPADPATGPTLIRFTGESHDAAWYRGFFAGGRDAQALSQLRAHWADACARQGHRSVWLAVSSLRGQDGPVTRIRAVGGQIGMPVSWSLSRTPLTVACLQEMKAFLSPFGITVSGVLLDAACCDTAIMDHLRESGTPFIAELNGGHPLRQAMMERHAAGLRWNCRHLLDGRGDAVFGVSADARDLGPDDVQGSVTLLFDAAAASSASLAFLDEMRRVEREVAKALAADGDAAVPEAYADCLELREDDGVKTPARLHDACQARLDAMGMRCVLSSQGLDAADTRRMLGLLGSTAAPAALPDAAELGGDALDGWLAAAMTAEILQCGARELGGRLDMDRQAMADALDSCRLIRAGEKWYWLNGSLRLDQPLCEALQLNRRSLAAMASLANEQEARRSAGGTCDDLVHSLPIRKSAAPVADTAAGADRPVGARQRKAEARRDLFLLVQQGGQVTVEMLIAAGLKLPEAPANDAGEAADPAADGSGMDGLIAASVFPTDATAPAPVRRRGRPKGSRNKKTLQQEAALLAAVNLSDQN